MSSMPNSPVMLLNDRLRRRGNSRPADVTIETRRASEANSSLTLRVRICTVAPDARFSSWLVLVLLFLWFTPVEARSEDNKEKISVDNAARVKVVAESDRRVVSMQRGPAEHEMTFVLHQGGIQIVNDETLLPVRSVAAEQTKNYVMSKDQSFVSWTNAMSGHTVVRNVKTKKMVEFDAGKFPHSSAFSPDGKRIAIGDAVTTDPTVEGSGFALVRLFDTSSGKLVHKLDQSQAGWGAVRPVFSPDGKLLAVGNRNYEMRLFDVATGKQLHEFPKRMTQEIAFSPDGKTIAAGYVDGTIALWDVASGKLLRSKESGAQEIYSVDWSPRGDLLATAGRMGKVLLWDPASLTVVKELIELPWVIQVRFTQDGTRLLTSGSDKFPIKEFKFNVWTVDGKVVGQEPQPVPKLERPNPVAHAERPNILFAIADDWGFPHAGVYGDPVVKTPNFDRIAREGILFQHAFVSSPSCTPSRGAVLTGKYHWELKGAANLWSVFPDEFATYPEILKEKGGYFTGYEGKGWGPGKTATAGRQLTGKSYVSFEQFLKERPIGTPFCYWLGTSDPHRPFKAGSGKAGGMDLAKIKVPACFPDTEIVRSDIADYYVEVQRFDTLVGNALKSLEAVGELDNTIVVMTSDHGMPFPRCKSNLYDTGARVPLAIRYGAKVKGGRTVEDLISLVDLAPTFLDVAGLYEPKDEDNDHSLWPLLASDKSGIVLGRKAQAVVFGKERHVPGQEAPDMGGYPSRALRYQKYLFIRNYQPDRWPNGTPNFEKAAIRGSWYADTDNGPTKSYMIENRDKDDEHRRLYDLAFAKRPAIELYDLGNDPDQLTNLASVTRYYAMVQMMGNSLDRMLKDRNDPRATGQPVTFDDHPYLGGTPKAPGFKPKE